jgi:hypothetical protein
VLKAYRHHLTSELQWEQGRIRGVMTTSLQPARRQIATVHPPAPLQRRGVTLNHNAAPVVVQRLVRRRMLSAQDTRLVTIIKRQQVILKAALRGNERFPPLLLCHGAQLDEFHGLVRMLVVICGMSLKP